MSYQKIVLFGNLGRDPEMRYLDDGTAVTSFSMATNRRWKNTDGSKGEEVVWWRVTCWRGLAEVVAQYLTKGRQVLVECRMSPEKGTGSPRTWQDSDGNWRASYEVVASSVIFGGSAGDTPSESGPAASPIEEDEVPF